MVTSSIYRVVDFRRNKDGIAAKVERLEYDPNRSAHIALLCYADGERHYIIAPKGVAVGDRADERARKRRSRPGNCLPIRNIPVGTDDALRRNAAGQGRADGAFGRRARAVLAREGTYAQVRLRSGEVRRVHIECRATIGEVGNGEHNLRNDRQGRRECAGAASARPFAAS